MPYIPPHDRRPLEFEQDAHPLTAGELNFCVTRLVHHYLERRGITYPILNEVIGVLECAKLELYRRVCVPYENLKIAQNGDVVPVNLKDIPNKGTNYATTTAPAEQAHYINGRLIPGPEQTHYIDADGRLILGGSAVTPARSQAADRCYRESRGPTREDVRDRSVSGQPRGAEDSDLREHGCGQNNAGGNGPQCGVPGPG